MDKAMRVGLYARVSTHDQQTLPMQLSAMREYAQRRGWEVVKETSEVGSGARERQGTPEYALYNLGAAQRPEEEPRWTPQRRKLFRVTRK